MSRPPKRQEVGSQVLAVAEIVRKRRCFFRGGTCVGQAQVSSEDEVEGEGVMEGRKAGNEQLSMMCWNVCGWLRKNGGQYEQLYEEYDMRSAVIGFYSPDVVAVVESWLKGEDELVVEGYKWLGNNRRNLHKNAVRGSGGGGGDPGERGGAEALFCWDSG